MIPTPADLSIRIDEARPKELSLRDYFAAAALTGAMSHLKTARHEVPDVARLVYRVADCLLAEREKKQ